MPRLHCTQRVLERFRLEPIADPTSESGRLGHWYANLLNVGRRRWVLCVSERTLLPVVVPAKNAHFPATLPRELGRVLIGLGINESRAQTEVRAMAELEIDRTRNRRVLGVMNDFAFLASHALADGLAPLETALRVARAPSGPLRHESPDRVTRRLFESETS